MKKTLSLAVTLAATLAFAGCAKQETVTPAPAEQPKVVEEKAPSTETTTTTATTTSITTGTDTATTATTASTTTTSVTTDTPVAATK